MDTHHKLLTAVNDLEQVTNAQLSDWLSLSYDHVRRNMTKLKKDGLVRVLYAHNREYQARGSMPDVFTLSATGKRKLRREGVEIQAKHKTSEQHAKPHTLAVNEFLIRGNALSRQVFDVKLWDYRHEHWLLSHPMHVPVSESKVIGIAPDLWMDFRLMPSGRFCFCVEINLHRVNQKKWREKVRAYLYCVPVYRELFQTDIIAVAVLIGTRENYPKRLGSLTERELEIRQGQAVERTKRMNEMLVWTEKELTAQNAHYMSDLFYFTQLPLDTCNPLELFLEPQWTMSNTSHAVPLMDVPGT